MYLFCVYFLLNFIWLDIITWWMEYNIKGYGPFLLIFKDFLHGLVVIRKISGGLWLLNELDIFFLSKFHYFWSVPQNIWSVNQKIFTLKIDFSKKKKSFSAWSTSINNVLFFNLSALTNTKVTSRHHCKKKNKL